MPPGSSEVSWPPGCSIASTGGSEAALTPEPLIGRCGGAGDSTRGTEGRQVDEEVAEHPWPHLRRPELSALVMAADPHPVVGVWALLELMHTQIELVLVSDLDKVKARFEAV